jgi:hypothetical protein
LAGGLNLYGFAAGDPVNFSDPFGLCPSDVGGDGKTNSVDDCPQDVQDAWAKSHIVNTSSNSTDIEGIDDDLMRAVVLTSMEFRMTFGISGGKEGGHSVEGRHSEGGGIDINSHNGIRFATMTDEAAKTVGNAIAVSIAHRLPYGRTKMAYSPGMAANFSRVLTRSQYDGILRMHRSHVHVTITP